MINISKKIIKNSILEKPKFYLGLIRSYKKHQEADCAFILKEHEVVLYTYITISREFSCNFSKVITEENRLELFFLLSISILPNLVGML